MALMEGDTPRLGRQIDGQIGRQRTAMPRRQGGGQVRFEVCSLEGLHGGSRLWRWAVGTGRSPLLQVLRVVLLSGALAPEGT